jgi:hypothetical protein
MIDYKQLKRNYKEDDFPERKKPIDDDYDDEDIDDPDLEWEEK